MTGSGWRCREATVASVFTAAVVTLRIALGTRVAACGTPDSCSYLGLAQALARGDRFRTPYLYDLQVDKLTLPTHGIEYWHPGTSFFILLSRLFGGVSLHGSIIVAVLAGVGMSAAAWSIAMRATGSRRTALASYVLCLVLPPLWRGSITPDSTLFYGLAVAWFLALFTVRRQGWVQDVAALAFVGVAYMVRNDAVLLLAPLVVVLWMRRRDSNEKSSTLYPVLMVIGFFFALAPAHLINQFVLGTIFPEAVGKALYLNALSDFANYRQPVSLHTLLATGIAHLFNIRLMTLALVVYRNLALNVGFALAFLPVLWMGRDRGQNSAAKFPNIALAETNLPETEGGVAFLVAMLAMYTLVLPVIGSSSAMRSFVALIPLAAVLTIVAILRASRDAQTARILIVAVVSVYLVSGVKDDRRSISDFASQAAGLRAIAAGLEAAGAQRANAVVMTGDPVQFSIATGFATVQFPVNGVEAIKGLADEMGVTYVVVDRDAPLIKIESALQPESVTTVPLTHSFVLALRAGKH